MIDYNQPPIKLSDDQIREISNLTHNGDRNYWKMYDYIAKNVPLDPDRKMWFEKAAEINRDDFTKPSNIYIREATKAGFNYDGQPPQNLQVISNDIGLAVYTDITDLKNRAIPTLENIINHDAGTAIHKDKMTLGGWGGAFYYWDARVDDPDRDGQKAMVGEIISRHPEELEKFLAVNAKATSMANKAYDREFEKTSNYFTDLTGVSTGLDIYYRREGMAAGWNAKLPVMQKTEIFERSATGNYTGSTEKIGVFKRSSNEWVVETSPTSPFGLPYMDAVSPGISKELDNIRNIRLSHHGILDDKSLSATGRRSELEQLNNPAFASAAAVLNKSGITLATDYQAGNITEEIARKLAENNVQVAEFKRQANYIPPSQRELSAGNPAISLA